MSKKDKLLERLSRNPKDASFSDLQTLLESVGYTLGKKRGKGSHSVFLKSGHISIVLPRQKPMKAIYVIKVLKIIKEQSDETK